jgi:glyoxylase-like metal-dependent hydrolase (beta-lactamase superfamily II)
MLFRQLIDFETRTYSYLLADPIRRKAVLIDPVLGQVDRDVALLDEMGLTLEYTLETGVHGDHLSGAAELRARTGSKIVVPAEAGVQGADVELSHGDGIYFGLNALEVRAIPGRTASNVMYITADLSKAFLGPTLLVRDLPRVDHPDSDLHQLFRSLQDNVLTLPDMTDLYPGRDQEGRTVTSVWEEEQNNPYLKGRPTEQEFVRRVMARTMPDRTRVDDYKARNSHFPHPEEMDLAHTETSPWAPIERTVLGVPEVTVDWVYSGEGDYRLIDVRGEGEFYGDLGHIQGSELVFLGALESQASQWDRSARYVTVCRSGGRSGRAATMMEKMGFKNVASMAGGMLVWNRKGFESHR